MCLAQKMGLLIELRTVVNDNDIVHKTIQRVDFSVYSVKETLASAMDGYSGTVPYNMERIYLFSGSDHNLVKSLMKEFCITEKVKLPSQLQNKLALF
ncbi:LOW QUALITY PROTEIN: threonine synthase-like 2 [Vipera latastei]